MPVHQSACDVSVELFVGKSSQPVCRLISVGKLEPRRVAIGTLAALPTAIATATLRNEGEPPVIWLLALHIIALLVWAACLLYLPSQIRLASAAGDTLTMPSSEYPSLTRFIYTHVATPAALLAIAAGTLVFVAHQIVALWLVAKLTLVVLLVGLHASLGLLVLRSERGETHRLPQATLAAQVVAVVLMLGIVWLVLAKPQSLGGLPGLHWIG